MRNCMTLNGSNWVKFGEENSRIMGNVDFNDGNEGDDDGWS